MTESASREDLVRRLKRIEGQVRGIQRMVAEDRACPDVLAQLSAVNEAVRRVSVLLAEKYAVECLADAEEPQKGAAKSRETIAALIDALMKAPR
jgi:CsoR family transcriptional regulator, copper-sensing transcriptional repressor